MVLRKEALHVPLDNQTSSIVGNSTKLERLLTPDEDGFIIMDRTLQVAFVPSKMQNTNHWT